MLSDAQQTLLDTYAPNDLLVLAKFFRDTTPDVHPIHNSFVVWNGKRWENQRRIPTRCFETARDNVYSTAQTVTDPALKTSLETAAKKFANTHTRHIVEFYRGLFSQDFTALDTNPDIINTQNCIVKLDTGEAIPHNRKYLLTQMAPIDYDPDTKQPKTWLNYLNDVFDSNTDLIDYIQKLTGYILTGGIAEQKMFYLLGKSGANGKSVFLDTLQNILGDYATTADSSVFTKNTLQIRNDIARLRGKRLVVLNELTDDARMDETAIKRITGGDIMTARFLNQETFEFVPSCKIVIASNYQFADTGTTAFWRRVRVVRFDVSFLGRENKSLKSELRAEYNQIFTWMVQGAVRYYIEGLNDITDVVHATKTMHAAMSPIRRFVEETCYVGAERRFVTKIQLYTAYMAWCEAHDEPVEGKIVFGRHLKRQFAYLREEHHNNQRCWRHIQLRSDAAVRTSFNPADHIIAEADFEATAKLLQLDSAV